VTASADEVAAARAVVEALEYDPDIGAVSNPVLARHYEVLEVRPVRVTSPLGHCRK
jgi:hypothetical protein